MARLFSPPTTGRPVGRNPFWCRFTYNVGLTLVKRQDNTYMEATEIPDDDVLSTAQVIYLGGHIYLISDAEAAALAAAGYGDGLGDVPVNPGNTQGGYGTGLYGVGDYGDGDPSPTPSDPYGSGPFGEGNYGD